MRPLSLDHLTVLGATPPELVDIAAELGYQALSPIIGAGKFDLPITPLRHGDPMTLAMARRMKDTGVYIHTMDGFPLFPESQPRDMRALLEVTAELGARNINTVMFDAEANHGLENFCLLAEEARTVGLTVVLEFFALSPIVASLDEALDFLKRAAQPNARLLIDVFHLNQSGGQPAGLKNVDPALIVSAQLSDGPLRQTTEQYAHTAFYERTIPGEGELPLVDFLNALPPGLPVGLEVPMKSLTDLGVPPRERARRCIDGARRVLARCQDNTA